MGKCYTDGSHQWVPGDPWSFPALSPQCLSQSIVLVRHLNVSFLSMASPESWLTSSSGAGGIFSLLRAWVQLHQEPHSPVFQRLFCSSTLCLHGIASCIEQWVVPNRCVTWLEWRSEEAVLSVQVTEMQVSVDFVHKNKNFALCCWGRVASKRAVILSKSC